MSEQTTGQGDFPPNWGFPSSIYNYCTGQYETGGMIWYGAERCTLDDVLALMEDPRNNGSIDRLSLCGTDDPAWTTERDVKLTQPCYKQKITVG